MSPRGSSSRGGWTRRRCWPSRARRPSARSPTFTLGYDDPSFSEWEYAREAARYYGTEHREILRPARHAREMIEQTVWRLDEPMTDLSAVPLYLLCREARRDVTVCMSGEGGDEVFIGYDRLRRLEGRPTLLSAAARDPPRGDRAPRHATPRSGAEEGPARGPASLRRGRAARARPGFTRPGDYFGSGMPSSARLFRETVLR